AITGSAGIDVIRGQGGDDVIRARDGDGNDFYDGGDGNNTVDYSASTGGVKVDLARVDHSGQSISGSPGTFAALMALGGYSDPTTLVGLAVGDTTGTDVLVGIVNVVGSSVADVVLGDSQSNLLYGLDGNDNIWGRGGNDVIRGGKGNDLLVGGNGG